MNDESERVRRVLLLGPSRAGTTTLIANVTKALERNAHGFGGHERFLFNATLAAAAPDGAAVRQPLGNLANAHELAQSINAASHGFDEWEFVLYPPPASLRGLSRPRRDAGVRVVLIDAPAKGIVFPQASSAAEPPQDELAEQLLRAHGLVVVWPMDRVDDFSSTARPGEPWRATNLSAEWTGAFGARVSPPKAEVCPRLETIVVAFSCFDRELATVGPDAAEAALDPLYVRNAIVDNLRRNPVFVHAIRSMTRWTPRIDLMAVSSFGLIGGYGETNWDAGSGQALIEPSGGGKLGAVINGARKSLPAEVGELWLPIFAADPVIRCAIRRRHRLMFPANELLDLCS